MSTDNDDRALLRASIRALVTRYCVAPQNGQDPGLWARIHAQIGGAAVAVPEQFGGAGGGLGDMVVILEELGAGLVASAMLGTSIAAVALAADADDSVRSRLLRRIAEDGCAATVVLDPLWAVDAARADIVLGVENGRLVQYDSNSTVVQQIESLDPTRSLASVDTSGSTRLDLGPAGDTVEMALTLAAAEQVGVAGRCLDKTIDYTATRIQFGRPIGSFQALKHRMADLHVRVEASRALVHEAAASLDENNCDAGAVAAASISASETLTAVAGEAVQMHGGIGVTWEHDISWYFKRAHGSRFLFGTPADRMARLVAAALK